MFMFASFCTWNEYVWTTISSDFSFLAHECLLFSLYMLYIYENVQLLLFSLHMEVVSIIIY